MTRKTKELHRNRVFRRTVFGAAISFCFFMGASLCRELSAAEAAALRVHNYVTKDTYDYTGTQVIYYVDGKKVPMSYPGLVLSDGSALGPCKEIFEEGLGVSSDYTDGATEFSLRYGPYTIRMTLGDKKAYVNGVQKILPNAPVLYSFQGGTEKYLYVPTRFVAESFGFSYTWDSAACTSSIQRPNVIYDGSRQVNYQGLTPSFSLNGRIVTSGEAPGYVFDGCALFAAEDFFEQTGLASYSYSEGSGLILLKRGDTLLRFVLESPVAYINETSYLLSTVPRLITPQGSSKAKVYLPAQFAADALGFEASYDGKRGVLQISGTGNGSIENIPGGTGVSGTVVPDTASYGEELFSYQTYQQVIEHFTALGYKVPESVAAYSCPHSDALYLRGIALRDVRITDKYDVIEIEIPKCKNPFGEKAYYNTENAYLNYCYLFGESGFKITIVKTTDLQYYSYDAPDGCVIHFTDTIGMYEDYIKFNNVIPTPDWTDIMAGENTLETLLPAAVFSRDYFVIRLPEGVTEQELTDNDEYAERRFTIRIPGNHTAFLKEQQVYNPVSALKNYTVSYRASDDSTILTFHTTKIQGYSYVVCGGYLAVKIADPPEIYDKIIVLDAGHGGIDPGTLRGSVYEKNVNFNVVNVYAPEYFKNSDIKVYYTRTTDTKISLENRAAFAKSVGADFFISFHVNAHSNATVAGTSVYYSTSNNQANAAGLKSSVLANTVLKQLVSEWGTKNRGTATAKFVVIHENTVPAVLIECGFITNDGDFQKIKDTAYQKKAAKAIFDAVNEIFRQYPTRR